MWIQTKIFSNKEYIKSKWTGTVLNNNVSLEIHSNKGKNNSLIYSQISSFINQADDIFNLQNLDSEIVRLNKNKKLQNLKYLNRPLYCQQKSRDITCFQLNASTHHA